MQLVLPSAGSFGLKHSVTLTLVVGLNMHADGYDLTAMAVLNLLMV